jgi:hypothetical protein
MCNLILILSIISNTAKSNSDMKVSAFRKHLILSFPLEVSQVLLDIVQLQLFILRSNGSLSFATRLMATVLQPVTSTRDWEMCRKSAKFMPCVTIILTHTTVFLSEKSYRDILLYLPNSGGSRDRKTVDAAIDDVHSTYAEITVCYR